MKSKDVALIIAIAGFSAIIAFLVSSTFIASNDNLSTEVEVVERIDTEFKDVDERYFNAQAINPTRLITVTENQNSNPFEEIPETSENPSQ